MKSPFTNLIKLLFTPILILAAFCTVFVPTSPVFASDSICGSNVPQEVQDSAGCSDTGKKLPNFVSNILNGIIAVMGFVAVIFVVVGGVQYMTSAGDTQKTEKAKKTIIYALIGMTVCVLSFAIVNFVIIDIIG